MTFPLHFARLASNATPRSSFSAGLYSVLHRLRDHPHFEIISPPAPVTLKRAQFLMGTLVEITAVAPSDAIAQASLTASFQEIRRLEKDRKSTRLNSSHGYISYAVFCLKKKKKKKNKTQ